MRLVCENCGTSYDAPDDPSFRYRCRHCDTLLRPPAPKASASSPDSDFHYLLSSMGHIRLPKNRSIILGRALDCDMVLEDPQVSRHHAKLIWNGYVFVLSDLDSHNGVLFDRARIHTAVLKDGDSFLVGGMLFLYRILVSREQLAPVLQAFRTGARKNATVDMAGPSATLPTQEFHGVLGTMGVMEICQLLRLNRRSGRLILLSKESGKGLLYFQEGEIVSASFDRFVGNDAVIEMISFRSGTFSFQTHLPPHAGNVTEKTDVLLLEAARRSDEALH